MIKNDYNEIHLVLYLTASSDALSVAVVFILWGFLWFLAGRFIRITKNELSSIECVEN